MMRRGTVRLASPEAGEAPLVDPNYLGDPRDVTTLTAGLHLIRG
jgi:choline dehydrogenase